MGHGQGTNSPNQARHESKQVASVSEHGNLLIPDL